MSRGVNVSARSHHSTGDTQPPYGDTGTDPNAFTPGSYLAPPGSAWRQCPGRSGRAALAAPGPWWQRCQRFPGSPAVQPWPGQTLALSGMRLWPGTPGTGRGGGGGKRKEGWVAGHCTAEHHLPWDSCPCLGTHIYTCTPQLHPTSALAPHIFTSAAAPHNCTHICTCTTYLQPPPSATPDVPSGDTHLQGPWGAVDVANDAIGALGLCHVPAGPLCSRPELSRQLCPHQPPPLQAGEGQCHHSLGVCRDIPVSPRSHPPAGSHTACAHGPLPTALPPCPSRPWCWAVRSRRITSSRTRLWCTHSASTPSPYW